MNEELENESRTARGYARPTIPVKQRGVSGGSPPRRSLGEDGSEFTNLQPSTFTPLHGEQLATVSGRLRSPSDGSGGGSPVRGEIFVDTESKQTFEPHRGEIFWAQSRARQQAGGTNLRCGQDGSRSLTVAAQFFAAPTVLGIFFGASLLHICRAYGAFRRPRRSAALPIK